MTDGSTRTYTYDDANQLTADGTATYTFDGTGNRNSGSYTTGTGNRISGDGTWTYTIDAEGNETKKSKGLYQETWYYSYDHRNQMTRAEKRSADDGQPSALLMSADYSYDWWGNRTEKVVDADGNGAGGSLTTRFAQDGWASRLDPLGRETSYVGTENWDVWADLDGSNGLSARYLRGELIDQVFAEIESETSWLVADRQGSTRKVLDKDGAMKNTIAYESWGAVSSESDTAWSTRYKYTGRELDTETDLQYSRWRYYDARLSRWTSEDPKGFDAGDSNLYRYVKNRQTLATDPSGLLLWAENTTVAKRIQAYFAGGVDNGSLRNPGNGNGITFRTELIPTPTGKIMVALWDPWDKKKVIETSMRWEKTEPFTHALIKALGSDDFHQVIGERDGYHWRDSTTPGAMGGIPTEMRQARAEAISREDADARKEYDTLGRIVSDLESKVRERAEAGDSAGAAYYREQVETHEYARTLARERRVGLVREMEAISERTWAPPPALVGPPAHLRGGGSTASAGHDLKYDPPRGLPLGRDAAEERREALEREKALRQAVGASAKDVRERHMIDVVRQEERQQEEWERRLAKQHPRYGYGEISVGSFDPERQAEEARRLAGLQLWHDFSVYVVSLEPITAFGPLAGAAMAGRPGGQRRPSQPTGLGPQRQVDLWGGRNTPAAHGDPQAAGSTGRGITATGSVSPSTLGSGAILLPTGNPNRPYLPGLPLGPLPPHQNAGPPSLPSQPRTMAYYIWQHSNGNWYYAPLGSATVGPTITPRPQGNNPPSWHHPEYQAATLSVLNNIQTAYLVINQTYVCQYCRPGSASAHLYQQPGDVLAIGQTLVVISAYRNPTVIQGMHPTGP